MAVSAPGLAWTRLTFARKLSMNRLPQATASQSSAFSRKFEIEPRESVQPAQTPLGLPASMRSSTSSTPHCLIGMGVQNLTQSLKQNVTTFVDSCCRVYADG